MINPLTAEDLWPLVGRLSAKEQIRLARMALREAERAAPDEARNLHAAYLLDEEDSLKDDALSWEGYGWDSVDPPRQA